MTERPSGVLFGGCVKFLGKWARRPRSARSRADTASREVAGTELERYGEAGGGYEPPQLVVIGNVRDLTTGSSSSGKKDANSQYYW